jgi:hypothetical protein
MDELQPRLLRARRERLAIDLDDVADHRRRVKGRDRPALEARELVVEAPLDVVAFEQRPELILAARRRRPDRPLEREPVDGMHPAAKQLDAHRLAAQPAHLGQDHARPRAVRQLPKKDGGLGHSPTILQ